MEDFPVWTFSVHDTKSVFFSFVPCSSFSIPHSSFFSLLCSSFFSLFFSSPFLLLPLLFSTSSFLFPNCRTWWRRFFVEPADLSHVRTLGTDGTVATSPLRSVCWKLNFGILSTDSRKSWTAESQAHREKYSALKQALMLDPSNLPAQADWERNNPLSQDEANPWRAYFEDGDLQKIIFQDVDRT